MLHVLFVALALAAPPPAPDHPVTGKPVQPTWTYSYTRSGPGWSAVCVQPPRGHRSCVLTVRWTP